MLISKSPSKESLLVAIVTDPVTKVDPPI